MEVAFVQIGLLPSVFYDLTWREFDMLSRHHESKVLHDWDIARTLGSWSVSPHTKKPIKPSDLLKLPTDKARKSDIPTAEEFKKIVEQYGKRSTT